jgi:lipopolysaccharide transport system ATP-binding protein
MPGQDFIVRVEQLSKRYAIGHQSPRALRNESFRDSLMRHARNFRRNAADLARGRPIVQGDEVEDFWALRDVSFDVARGEVVGIIGLNGAGKTTLLKILSRITEPTGGRVTLRGRVASLLEVGTGFHPELSGRENIYLNGTILGMTRAEISERFDEIVRFAEVETFLDTPVKRYSSGMYVRLAFAVAAHLEPEILIIDEVLAVGDATFQRKCLGKMNAISGAGRTILFVSHNMQAVRQLCHRVVWLKNGRVVAVGPAEEMIEHYLAAERQSTSLSLLNEVIAQQPPDPAFRLKSVDVLQDNRSTVDLQSGKPVQIRFEYDVFKSTAGLHVYFLLCDPDGSLIFDSLHNGDAAEHSPVVEQGSYVSVAEIPANFLAARGYELQVQAAIQSVRAFFTTPPAVALHVHATGIVNRAYSGYSTPGKIAPLIPWRTEKLERAPAVSQS